VHRDQLASSLHDVERLVVGVDVAKRAPMASLMDERYRVHETVSWAQPFETACFVEFLESLPVAQVEVAMEPSGTYGDALRAAVLGRGFRVYRVSPKRSHDAAEVYDGVPSWHDAKSAAIVAKLHLEGASEPWPLRSNRERELQAVVKLVGLYEQRQRVLSNRLEALLARHWPELLEQLELSSATLLELVARFGSPQAVAAEGTSVACWMGRVGRGQLKASKIQAVVAAAASTLGLCPVAAEVELLKTLAREARHCQLQAREHLRRLESWVDTEPSVAALGAVIGKKTAAVLVAMLGDPRNYRCPRSYRKALGLNLKQRSSGTRQGELTITKRGPGLCRWYLYLAVLRLIQSDEVARTWYQRKVARDGGRKKNRAVIAVMRKLALALRHVAHGEPFDTRRLWTLPARRPAA